MPARLQWAALPTREPVPGGGGPGGDPSPERLRVLRHSLQGAGDGVQGGLRAPVLPAHADQAEEIRLPVHRWGLVRGGGGETLGVRLPPLLLSLPPPRPLGLELGGVGTVPGEPPSLRFRVKEMKLEIKQKKRILSIL